MSTFTYHKPGIGNASSYIVSGTPWHTSSLAPALSTTSTVINLPRVTNSITIKNTSTTGDVLRFTLNNDNIVDNTNYITLEDGESFSAELRVVDVQLISDSETPVPFTILAGLTNIDRKEMYGIVPSAPNLLAWVQKQKFYHTDENPDGDRPGYGNPGIVVSSLSKTVAVSAYRDNENGGTNAGAVFIFDEIDGSYQQVQKLTASFGTDGNPEISPESDRFSQALSFSANGEILAIGAYLDEEPGHIGNNGSVYIFQSSSVGYQQVQKLVPSFTGTDTTGNQFGFTVSLADDGNTLAVGAVYEDELGTLVGGVYVYTSGSSGFIETQRIQPVAPVDLGEQFGQNVMLSATGTRMAVSSNVEKTITIFESGSSGYQNIDKVTVPLTFPVGNLYKSDANSDITVIVCADAFNSEIHVIESGSSGYAATQIITASTAGDILFGYSLHVNDLGNQFIVGASTDPENGIDSGAAYIFTNDGADFKETKKLIAVNEPYPEGDRFGYGVFLIDNDAFVVSAYDEVSGSTSGNQGSIYRFKYTRDY